MDETTTTAPTIHPTHKTVEHPRKGLFCSDCKAYTYGKQPEKLSEECPGPVDFSKTK